MADFNVDDEDEEFRETYGGRVDWTAMRTKYFLMGIKTAQDTPAIGKNLEPDKPLDRTGNGVL